MRGTRLAAGVVIAAPRLNRKKEKKEGEGEEATCCCCYRDAATWATCTSEAEGKYIHLFALMLAVIDRTFMSLIEVSVVALHPDSAWSHGADAAAASNGKVSLIKMVP